MTLKQIERIRDSLSKIKFFTNNPDAEAIVHLDDKLQNFFGKEYTSPSLSSWQHIYNGIDITKQDMIYDIDNIVSVLEGMLSILPYYGEIEYCLDLIDEGKRFIESKVGNDDFQRKVVNTVFSCDFQLNDVMNYYKEHPEKIHNENCTNLADMQQTVAILERHVESIIKHNSGTEIAYNNGKKQDTNININQNISNNASSESNVTLDIAFSFQAARKKAEDEGLADEQYKAVMDKLVELENIAKSKETKGKRWAKAKEIMKWLIEQGLQVAGILLPVLAQTIK